MVTATIRHFVVDQATTWGCVLLLGWVWAFLLCLPAFECAFLSAWCSGSGGFSALSLLFFYSFLKLFFYVIYPTLVQEQRILFLNVVCFSSKHVNCFFLLFISSLAMGWVFQGWGELVREREMLEIVQNSWVPLGIKEGGGWLRDSGTLEGCFFLPLLHFFSLRCFGTWGRDPMSVFIVCRLSLSQFSSSCVCFSPSRFFLTKSEKEERT